MNTLRSGSTSKNWLMSLFRLKVPYQPFAPPHLRPEPDGSDSLSGSSLPDRLENRFDQFIHCRSVFHIASPLDPSSASGAGGIVIPVRAGVGRSAHVHILPLHRGRRRGLRSALGTCTPAASGSGDSRRHRRARGRLRGLLSRTTGCSCSSGFWFFVVFRS